ncbi:MAG: HigA family addiction module antidote protein [Gammaproteobacteria bacterium]|nr:HigA family addiction module antidote protein [Gammaproteobacteria bacterium]
MNNMRPIHPGEHLQEEMDELGLNASQVAEACGVPPNRITQILNGDRGITADTALRFSLYFGTTPEFWMNLQQAYDLRVTRRDAGKRIKREVRGRAA